MSNSVYDDATKFKNILLQNYKFIEFLKNYLVKVVNENHYGINKNELVYSIRFRNSEHNL